jgi:hypothetical protein
MIFSLTDWGGYKTHPINITLPWIIGFIEGECYFTYSGLKPAFEIGQKATSIRAIAALNH